ncbi:hypothetical protein V12B01_13140 [Vibrio splendidus 12B01]|nr:hypothetical protein V12B01_13140 [Vibrio splendidus 12B01]
MRSEDVRLSCVSKSNIRVCNLALFSI